MNDSGERWIVGWAEVERDQRRREARATVAEKFAWLEEMIELVMQSGKFKPRTFITEQQWAEMGSHERSGDGNADS